MKTYADLHMHTSVSQHAYSTLDEMVVKAEELGLHAIAITDHGPGMMDGASPIHFYGLQVIPSKIGNVTIYKGVELNILNFDGDVDLEEGLLKRLDFTIASYHSFAVEPSTFENHTKGWLNVIKNPYVDCLGHMGNPVFNCDIDLVIKECLKYNKILEINSSSFKSRKGSYEVCKEIAKLCKKYSQRVVVNSDAHYKHSVGEHTAALEMLDEIDFPESLVINANIDTLNEYFKSKRN